MEQAANVLIGIIALEHVWFLVLEMFLWKKPIGQKTFRTTPEFAAQSAVLAANQGLYNGFLVAGLVWSLLASDSSHAIALKLFFVGCVAVAGIFGGATSSRKIFFFQGVPALGTLALLFALG